MAYLQALAGVGTTGAGEAGRRVSRYRDERVVESRPCIIDRAIGASKLWLPG